MWVKLIWVGLGGCFGAVSRYLIGGLVQGWTGSTFPYGTLTVNSLGSFFLGLLGTLSITTGSIPVGFRLMILTGFLGSLTTFSTFSFESFQLLKDGLARAFLLNISGNILLCLVFVWLGYLASKLYLGEAI